MPARRNLPHVLLPGPTVREPYQPPRSSQRTRLPTIEEPERHGRRLLERFDELAGPIRAVAEPKGLLMEVEGFPDFDLNLLSLDAGGLELRAVTRRPVAEGGDVERAVVFVPSGKIGKFRQKIERYLGEGRTVKGRRKNAGLIDTIHDFDRAVLRSLWTEREPFPDEDQAIWWEVWLRREPAAGAEREVGEPGPEWARFQRAAEAAGIRLRPRLLVFGDRTVAVALTTASALATAFEDLDDLAELRRARETAEFFRGLRPPEQMEWIQELLDRTSFSGEDAPAVCVLDTGVNRFHPLLEPALPEESWLACMGWSRDDHHGHGTEMAGLALLGDLTEALPSTDPLELRHQLESVKILPPPGREHSAEDDGPDLWGAITAEACARAEIAAPERRRCFSMAVTASACDRGQPTSWSAAVDALAAGHIVVPTSDDLELVVDRPAPRLIVVSAGNVGAPGPPHPENCDTALVEDPAQAWNALTVGAFTERAVIEGAEWDGWSPVARPGDLSPYSTTSVTFEPQWPIKPEVVLEGGNAAVSASGAEVVSEVPSLSLLTTSRDLLDSPFELSNATSAACSLASRMAARLSAGHPHLWPESIRGLIVHSARWTPPMTGAFDAVGNSKRQRLSLLRRYGYGVPDFDRAAKSARDAVTLLAQSTIHPFEAGRMREMDLYQLPWPDEVLRELGGESVRLRVTLSYFIEPNPGRRGWTKRFSYASHGLRFEIKGGAEDDDHFRWRLNERARLEEEGERNGKPQDPYWFLGEAAQNKGSIHSDCWTGPAAVLAERSLLAVYPVGGWWKHLRKRDRSADGVRYCLVVSIESDAEDIDLWTPVAIQAGIPIPV